MDGLPVERVENERGLNGNGTEIKRERNGIARSSSTDGKWELFLTPTVCHIPLILKLQYCITIFKHVRNLCDFPLLGGYFLIQILFILVAVHNKDCLNRFCVAEHSVPSIHCISRSQLVLRWRKHCMHGSIVRVASERQSSSVIAPFASFVATSPILVSSAVGSDRFKYFNNAIASSA